MIDLRPSTSSDVAIRVSGPPLAAGRTTTAWLEAKQLQAVQELGDVFREHCDALGGRKHFAHFETWLWAARGQSSQLNGVIPPIPSPRPDSSARAELMRKLSLAGQSKEGAAAICDALDACCHSLLARVRHAAAASSVASASPRPSGASPEMQSP